MFGRIVKKGSKRRNRKRLWKVGATLLAVGIVACLIGRTRLRLTVASFLSEPTRMTLSSAGNAIDRTFLSDGTEVGVMRLTDGTSARYWFLSHHVTGDDGGTLFLFSDGSREYLDGHFCCENDLTDTPFATLSDLRDFVRTSSGPP